jgi:hypothetical protein
MERRLKRISQTDWCLISRAKASVKEKMNMCVCVRACVRARGGYKSARNWRRIRTRQTKLRVKPAGVRRSVRGTMQMFMKSCPVRAYAYEWTGFAKGQAQPTGS